MNLWGSPTMAVNYEWLTSSATAAAHVATRFQEWAQDDLALTLLIKETSTTLKDFRYTPRGAMMPVA